MKQKKKSGKTIQLRSSSTFFTVDLTLVILDVW